MEGTRLDREKGKKGGLFNSRKDHGLSMFSREKFNSYHFEKNVS